MRVSPSKDPAPGQQFGQRHPALHQAAAAQAMVGAVAEGQKMLRERR